MLHPQTLPGQGHNRTIWYAIQIADPLQVPARQDIRLI
jgi:hypothetical protein